MSTTFVRAPTNPGPFSAKILNNFQSQVVPLLFGEQAPFRGKVRVIVRPVPQPWHASSSLLHETALAVARLSLTDRVALEDPEKNAFWVFSQALMKESERWYDGPARSKNPDQVRAELATLAVNVLGEDVRKAKKESIVALDGQPLGQAVRSWTRVSDEGNAGSKIVPDLKYCVRRYADPDQNRTPERHSHHADCTLERRRGAVHLLVLLAGGVAQVPRRARAEGQYLAVELWRSRI